MTELLYLPPTMIWPLLACLVLTGIHVYLGVHVIARKVIFVDLALAQIAALGTVIGVLLGYEVGTDTTALYLYSLAFTIFGAFVFSITRMRGEKIPHEAIIGIVYAVTFASTILVLSKSALGPQELDHIIKGELLWVQPATVIKTAVIYLLVGLFHFAFRKKFMAISFDIVQAEASGINVRLWDFLFYMSFGFVITSSVAIAGVFLVFSYLVIPSVGAMLLSDKLGVRLAIGWIAGSIISFIGVKLSYSTGLPTSPAIVVILAAGLFLSGIIYHLRHSERLLIGIRDLAVAGCVILLFIGGVWYFRKADEDPLQHTLKRLDSPMSTERSAALADLRDFTSSKNNWFPRVIAALRDSDAEVRQSALQLVGSLGDQTAAGDVARTLADPVDDVRKSALDALRKIGGPASAGAIFNQGLRETDPELQVEFFDAALSLGDGDAIPRLADLLDTGGVFANDAYTSLRRHLAYEFSQSDGKKVKEWWERHRGQARWDQSRGQFGLGN